MEKLRVVERFRDENNFFIIHEKGDTVEVTPNRAAQLLDRGFCERLDREEPKETIAPSVEEPKKRTRRTKA
jgi:hypothetical protein